MKSLLRNALLVLGLGAGLHGGAGASGLYSSGAYFVDPLIVTDWSDADSQAASYTSSGIGNFATIRTEQEQVAAFAAVLSAINGIFPTDSSVLNARFYIGLRFSVRLSPFVSGWDWQSGDSTFTNSLTRPSQSPLSIPWGQPSTTYADPIADSGAYIYCSTLNNTRDSCDAFSWGYASVTNIGNILIPNYFVMQEVPVPASLGLMLAGLIGLAGVRRSRP